MVIMEQEDAGITRGVLATMYNQRGWAASGIGAYGGLENLAVSSPFLIIGEALQISSKVMHIDRPYPFQFINLWFIAVKRADGDLDFYYIG